MRTLVTKVAMLGCVYRKQKSKQQKREKERQTWNEVENDVCLNMPKFGHIFTPKMPKIENARVCVCLRTLRVQLLRCASFVVFIVFVFSIGNASD